MIRAERSRKWDREREATQSDKDKSDEGATCMCFNAVAHARALNIVNELHGRWNGSPLTFFVRRESTTPLRVNYNPGSRGKKDYIYTANNTRALYRICQIHRRQLSLPIGWRNSYRRARTQRTRSVYGNVLINVATRKHSVLNYAFGNTWPLFSLKTLQGQFKFTRCFSQTPNDWFLVVCHVLKMSMRRVRSFCDSLTILIIRFF